MNVALFVESYGVCGSKGFGRSSGLRWEEPLTDADVHPLQEGFVEKEGDVPCGLGVAVCQKRWKENRPQRQCDGGKKRYDGKEKSQIGRGNGFVRAIKLSGFESELITLERHNIQKEQNDHGLTRYQKERVTAGCGVHHYAEKAHYNLIKEGLENQATVS